MDTDQPELQHQLGGLCPAVATPLLARTHIAIPQEQLMKCLHVTRVTAEDFFVRPPGLDAGICDRLCATICLLLLRSAGSARPLWAASSPGSSRSNGYLAFVTRLVKHLGASVGRGDGVRGSHDHCVS